MPVIRAPIGYGPGGNLIYSLGDLGSGEELDPFCPGDAIPLEGLGCDNATSLEWTGGGPPGANANLTSNNTPNTVLTGSVPGSYSVKLCCFTDDGPANPDPLVGPFLDAPYGHPAGELLVICVTGCGDGAASNWVVSGATTNVDFDDDCALISTDPGGGAVTVTVTCFYPDGSLSPPVTETVQLFDPTLDLVTEDTDPACIRFRQCKVTCECDTVVINIDACESRCTSDVICLVAKDKQPIAEPPELPELQVMPIIGEFPATSPLVFKDTPDDDCKIRTRCLAEQHRPHFIWNDCLFCPGWTVEGDAAAAANCDPGDKWCFSGTGQYSASGPTPCAVDMAIILDHNIQNATIDTTPGPFGGPVTTGAVFDAACVGGYVRPIAIPLDATALLPEVTSLGMTINGTAVGGGDIKIGRVIFGRKLFLPQDSLGTWNNPHYAAACEFDVKRNACGERMSQQMTRALINWSVTIGCIEEDWMCDVWEPYMRYLCSTGAEVLFQWSRNNKPWHLLVAHLRGAQPPPRYTSNCLQEVTLNLEGYNQQQQPKQFG